MALPTLIDPRKLALQEVILEGTVNVEDLPRLASSVTAICAPLWASVQFKLDESRAKDQNPFQTHVSPHLEVKDRSFS